MKHKMDYREQVDSIIKYKGHCYTTVSADICDSLCPIGHFCSKDSYIGTGISPGHNERRVAEAIRVGLERFIITEAEVFEELL